MERRKRTKEKKDVINEERQEREKKGRQQQIRGKKGRSMDE